jgi:hypothetical protein
MNEEEIRAFCDFMKHSSEKTSSHSQKKEDVRKFYEKKASEFGVSVEYYIAEFI